VIEYCSPRSAAEALEILAAHHGDARIIAGGTDLLPDIRQDKKRARCLVDITQIPGFDSIAIENEYIVIGAAVTFSELRRHPYLQTHVHALAEAAAAVGAADIQNAATWVGNLAQAMPAADGATVALALEAEIQVQDADGECWLPVTRLFAGPGRSTVDSTRQLITRIRFRIPGRRWGTAWRRIGRRDSLVLPILNCAVKLEVSDGQIAQAAIALGPVAPIPFRATAAEQFLLGREPSESVFAHAARIAQEASNPRSSSARASREYRLAVLPELVREALSVAATRANQ
jgi:CO/xanthine dehydrogenase FAD-binding subunit